ncbi:MAG: hypothetical protein AB7S38_02520 [Vulcanimicrobiota bacterium]
MNRADRENFKRMAIGFCMICVLSAGLHIYLIKKGVIEPYRMKPVYTVEESQNDGALLAQGKIVIGEVSATSYDRFYIKTQQVNQPFLLGQLTAPAVGSHVRVVYAPGRPPVALKIETAAP